MLSQDQKELIEKQKQIAILAQRKSRYEYLGLLSDYQLNRPSLLFELEYTKLNPYQHFLFKRVLHGLNVYTKEEITKLHWDKKRRITKVWKRSQKEINAWKQTICNKRVNRLFKKTFTGSSVEYIVSIPCDEILEDYHNTLSFKQLNIEYEDVILYFMSKGLLPKNYLTLKRNNN